MHIVLLLLFQLNDNYRLVIDRYIIQSFAEYDSVSYSIKEDVSKFISLEINRLKASNRIGDKFFIPVKFVDQSYLEGEKFITVEVKLYKKVFISKNSIARGEPVDKSNTVFKLQDVTGISQNTFLGQEDLSSKIAKYDLKAGTIICNEYLEEAPIMKVGDQVYLVYQFGSVIISFIGTVRQPGAAGDIIKIKANKMQYSARVINSNEAIILE